MITLGLIAYIVISSWLSYDYTKDKYSLIYGRRKGMERKRAIKYGFSFIPLLALAVAIVIGGVYVLGIIAAGVIRVLAWIAINMP
ncbi:membrane protein [Bacillus phage vB_BcgM]|nr:membrane protein [Bacillus phage vB_BcgM]